MALDACFLTYLTREINDTVVGARVDKIYQPGRDEIMLALRAPGLKTRLLISCTPNCARITLTEKDAENPAQPPLFCMVLRKHLIGAKLERVYMPAFERAVFVEFVGKNDFFEPVKKTLVLEILGRTSNLLLMDGEQRIIEAIRHVDLAAAGRQILPGLRYTPVTPQNKKEFITASAADVPLILGSGKPLWKAILDIYSGISPVVARELAYTATNRIDPAADGLTPNQRAALGAALDDAARSLAENICAPHAVRGLGDQWIDFSFRPIRQYGAGYEVLSYRSPVALIEEYYEKSAASVRLKQKTRDIEQLLSRTSARIERTMRVREKELEEGKRAEFYRICGELIQANLHKLSIGQTSAELENYYEEGALMTVPLRPDKTPQQNAQLYFKKYRKAKTSARVVADLVKQDREDLSYLDSVFLALCDCETAAEVDQLREELVRTGFCKNKRKTAARSAPAAGPRKFMSSSGFTILVGRNNVQNDQLTVRLSRKDDLWLHTKNVHSAHVLIQNAGREIDDQTILEAASICAYYSRARESSRVEVDYCPVSHVKKPNGARPGMVVYEGCHTVIVAPGLQNKDVFAE